MTANMRGREDVLGVVVDVWIEMRVSSDVDES